MEVGKKQKGRRFKKSTSTQKASFKSSMTGLEDKVFNFKKSKNTADLVKNCEEIYKYTTVNYKHG